MKDINLTSEKAIEIEVIGNLCTPLHRNMDDLLQIGGSYRSRLEKIIKHHSPPEQESSELVSSQLDDEPSELSSILIINGSIIVSYKPSCSQ